VPGGRTHKAIRGDAIPPLIPLEKVKNANTAQEEYSSIIPPQRPKYSERTKKRPSPVLL